MLDARRRAVLDAMGIELWHERRKGTLQVTAVGPVDVADDASSAETAAEPDHPPSRGVKADTVPAGSAPVAAPAQVSIIEDVSTLDWDALRSSAMACQSCTLHAQRTQAVFGVGRENARLMVIGEAPGADEDRQGEPFVGRAGQLLNAMLSAIGFARGEVFIANIVKCRPPGNRDPHVEEAAACRGYLERQIALVRPQLILAVGRVSAQNLLGTDQAVGRLRGAIHRFEPGDVPLIVTYHPAYLLRKPQEKAKSWQDLQAAWRWLRDADTAREA